MKKDKIKKIVRSWWFTPLTVLIALTVSILDLFLKQFNVIVPVIIFLWKLININIPFYAIIILAILASIVLRHAINKKDKFILSLLDGRELNLSKLLSACETIKMSGCIGIIGRLEARNLILSPATSGGIKDIRDVYFRLTEKGQKRLKRIEYRIKKMAEDIYNEVCNELRNLDPTEEEITPIKKEIIYTLQFLANEEDKSSSKSVLRFNYTNMFTDKEMSDFNYMWSVLENKRLVEPDLSSGGYSELKFTITHKGLKFYNDYKNILEA